ncbi:hypothetical protein KP509_01G040900 [Ceratopteris richardii]|uniref:Uncharacterized protein n=1 Tax=Ceratopteris richardii TaxID=49495 RepID=A0A8T2VCD0_CERRI|nr:hypothetical protein KP509_01G040900 [Ceratopteris richardii]
MLQQKVLIPLLLHIHMYGKELLILRFALTIVLHIIHPPPPSPPTISTPHASPPIQIPSPRISPLIQPHHTSIHVPPIPIPPIPPPMPSPGSPSPTILVTPSGSHMHSTSTQPMHSNTSPLAPFVLGMEPTTSRLGVQWANHLPQKPWLRITC